MAKKGMARSESAHTQPRNDVPPVPELQGKAKHTKTPAPPIVAGTSDPHQKVWHHSAEKPIDAKIYPVIDTDLGRDNVENDIPAADLQVL